MATVNQEQTGQLLDALTQHGQASNRAALNAQYERKLAALQRSGEGPPEMLSQLRTMWQMLAAPDEVVPFGQKALIMGAIAYFVSPLDLLPDPVGKAGYLDDAMVVRMVFQRLDQAYQAFDRWQRSTRLSGG